MLCLSYYIKLKLMRNQKLVMERDGLMSTGLLWTLFQEIIFVAPHPNLLTHDLEFTINSANITVYAVNDILALLILLRCYIFVRVILNNTSYATTRS